MDLVSLSGLSSRSQRTKRFRLNFRSDDFLLAPAWSMVERIARACLSHDLPAVLQQADGLIGLGDGLTPSGDDFLGGLFYACFLLSSSYPLIQFWGPADLPAWVDAHRSSTNLISFALLRDNSSGHALEPLSRLGLHCLRTNRWKISPRLALDLVKVGHSTGWSLLAGFMTGLLGLTN